MRQWQESHFMNYAWKTSGDCNEPVSHCHSLREESPDLVHGFELLISKPSWEGSGTCGMWDLAQASLSLSLVDELWGLIALPTPCSLSLVPVCGQPASQPCCHAFPGCGRDERCLEQWAKVNPFFPSVLCSEYFIRATETQLIQRWISNWRFWGKLNHVMSWICKRIRGQNTSTVWWAAVDFTRMRWGWTLCVWPHSLGNDGNSGQLLNGEKLDSSLKKPSCDPVSILQMSDMMVDDIIPLFDATQQQHQDSGKWHHISGTARTPLCLQETH